MSVKETLFIITHPIAAVEAKLRQIEVGIDAGGPPAGTTIEEFAELPVSQAAKLIREARKSEAGDGGGIQLSDYSKEDQARLQRGEKPKGVPIHRNL
ncbi:MAG: hypothetical protein AAB504_00840 [Patescibacteria group bacterium]